MPSLADSYEAMLEEYKALGPPFPPVSTNEPGIVFAVLAARSVPRKSAESGTWRKVLD